MSEKKRGLGIEKKVDGEIVGEGGAEGADVSDEDLQITVTKIEFPVKPRGVLAE